jgi:ketosteroid isomerase-like protein
VGVASPPPPDEREVIAREVESMRMAAQSGNVNGILSRLDKGFKYEGASKDEIRAQLTAFFFSRGDVRVSIAGLNVQVDSESATSDATYSISWSGEGGSSQSGRFRAQWRKVDGQWKIASVSGADNLGAP